MMFDTLWTDSKGVRVKKVIKIIKMIPGYIMIIPLFIGMIIHLSLDSGGVDLTGYTDVVGWITTGLMAVLVFGICAKLNFRKLGTPFKRGGVLLGVKFIVSALVGLAVGLFFGAEGFWGISVMAMVAAMSCANLALFAGLGQTYGDKHDIPSLMVLAPCLSPAFTIIVLAIGGFTDVNIQAMDIILPIIPMVLGILVGNLWPKVQPILYKIAGATLPVFSLLLGTTISFKVALTGGAQGLILGVIVLATGLIAFFLSRLYMGKGKNSPMAAGIGITAGSAIMIPTAIEKLGLVTGDIIMQATAQIAGSMIITVFLCPIIVAVLFKWEKKRRAAKGIPMFETWNELDAKGMLNDDEPIKEVALPIAEAKVSEEVKTAKKATEPKKKK